MPLTGEAKRVYQRDYMRRKRSNTGQKLDPVRPPLKPVRPVSKLQAVGLKMAGNKIMGVEKGAEPLSELPMYNPIIHKAGEKVRVFDGNKMVEIVVPEFDTEGQSIPEGASSASLRSNFHPFKPSFRPAPKPLSKRGRYGSKC